MATHSASPGTYQAPLQRAVARYLDRSEKLAASATCMNGDTGALLTIPPLTAVAYLKTNRPWVQTFTQSEISLIEKPFPSLGTSTPADSSAQVVLIELDDLTTDEKSLVEALWTARSFAVAGLTDATTYQELEWLCSSLDAIGPATSSPAGIAWLIRTAYVQSHEKRRFSEQLRDLEEKMRQKELVARAKAIIANHGKTTEAEALRQLRNESRKQRRSMWELAQLIIDAHSIMCPKPHQRPGVASTAASEFVAMEEDE